MIFITQSLIDVLDPAIKLHGQALLDNSSCKAFMGLDGENLKQAKDLYNFTDKESQVAFSKLRGQGLFILGNQRMHLKVRGFEHEIKAFGRGGGK